VVLVLSIPGRGGAEPDRRRGWTELRREPGRAQIAQPAVRSSLIVFAAVVSDHHARFRQRPQLLPIQALVPEAPVKTFHKAVLPRTTWLDVNRLDMVFRQPPLHDLGDELRPVVRTQIFRCPLLLNGFLQPGQHVLRAQSAIHPQHMTLPRMLVQDRQDPQCPATHRSVGDKVPRPYVVSMRRRGRQTTHSTIAPGGGIARPTHQTKGNPARAIHFLFTRKSTKAAKSCIT